jgi:hypothetical protein
VGSYRESVLMLVVVWMRLWLLGERGRRFFSRYVHLAFYSTMSSGGKEGDLYLDILE